MRSPRWLVPLVPLALVLSAPPLHAQFLKKLKDKVEKRVDDGEDRAIDKALDKVAKCVSTNTACIAQAMKSGKPVVITDTKGNRVSAADSAKAVAAAGAGAPAGASARSAPAPATAFVNYDFVPGDKVLFAEDFSGDQVGDIPSRVQVTQGNWEVADYEGRRWLRTTSGGWFAIPLPGVLPDKFTLEADVIQTSSHNTDFYFLPESQRDGHNYVFSGYSGGIGDFSSAPLDDISDKLYHVRIMADGEHVKVYEDGKRVANVPQAKLGRSNRIFVEAPGNDNEPYYITDIRIAESQKKLFDVLSANGRVATHGILFDVNSATIRPESAPTLQEIGDMLKAHPDLRLTIEGHTDNTGDGAANQTLSDQRAASVKTYLVSTFGIDGARLQTKGYGASKPVAPNTTPEGKQQNRRVELVKM